LGSRSLSTTNGSQRAARLWLDEAAVVGEDAVMHPILHCQANEHETHVQRNSLPVQTTPNIVQSEHTDCAFSRPLVLVIDPRSLTRHSVSQLLERSMSDASVLAVSNIDELFANLSGAPCDHRLIVFNIGGGRVREEHFLNELSVLRERLPNVPVVVVAERSHLDDVAEVLRRGVRGYIPTTLHPSVAIGAVRLVQAGGTFIPENAFLEMLDETPPRRSTATDLGTQEMVGNEFTPRQNEVLKLLREGKSNKTIARELNMQESTVKVHVRQIMKKLKAANRTQAVVIASHLQKPSIET
jgi:DNA-binding NarL/FixJ family response regulator